MTARSITGTCCFEVAVSLPSLMGLGSGEGRLCVRYIQDESMKKRESNTIKIGFVQLAFLLYLSDSKFF